MSDPTDFISWWKSLPIPWLVGGPVGQAEATSLGTVLNTTTSLVKQATTAHMPGRAPADALSHIGGDRQLEQGPTESNANFVIRLRSAWDDWARAGTALEMLVQLYWAGFSGAVLIQQNGLAFSLSGAPTAGVDPTSLLVTQSAMPHPQKAGSPGNPIVIQISGGGALGVMTFAWSYNGGAFSGSVLPTAGATYTFAVPGTNTSIIFAAGTYVVSSTYTVNGNGSITLAGGAINTVTQNSSAWWSYDGLDYFASRFTVLFPTFNTFFQTSGTATFVGTEDGTAANPWPIVTWNNAFVDTTYTVQVGAVYSSDPVTVSADNTTKTKTGISIAASGPMTGTVDVLAWQAGAVPFGDIHPQDLARLRRIVARWKPAKATCTGIVYASRLPVWGWPLNQKWGDAGLKWGVSNSVRYAA